MSGTKEVSGGIEAATHLVVTALWHHGQMPTKTRASYKHRPKGAPLRGLFAQPRCSMATDEEFALVPMSGWLPCPHSASDVSGCHDHCRLYTAVRLQRIEAGAMDMRTHYTEVIS